MTADSHASSGSPSFAPLRVGILGATGAVGQKMVRLLSGHPWFRVARLMGSARSVGLRYGEAVRWLEPVPLPSWARELPVREAAPSPDCDFVLSALESRAAGELEGAFSRAGMPVISNAGAHRLLPSVPLLVPEVNPDHAERIGELPIGRGFIVANPNCSTTGLVLALKPLLDECPIERVLVTTLQAVSGAGYPGVPSMDILGNAIPVIPGEEEKLEGEPLKIFGKRVEGGFRPARMSISAQTNRVPVLDGHLLSVSVGFSRPLTPARAAALFEGFRSPLEGMGLPSAPLRPVALCPDSDGPQPRLHSDVSDGMSVSVGRLRSCPVLDLRFVVLVHNTVRGAGGGAILNAELLRARGWLREKGV